MLRQPDVDRAGLARQAAAADDRDLPTAVVDTDATAEEQLRLARAPDRKQAGVLQEERTFFREEEVEAIEIDLLFVDFDLRKIGVVRRVECEAGRQAVLADLRRTHQASSYSSRLCRAVAAPRARTA